MNIEQEARDVLNEISAKHGNAVKWTEADTRENSRVVEAVCRALETHNDVRAKLEQSEKALDAYRREVSEALRDALPWTAHGKSISAQQRHRLSSLITPEPVDPLTATLDELGVDRADFDAALAKIGGKVVFGEGA